MTVQQTKQKVLDAWLDQTAKYATGPVVGERYLYTESDHSCSLFCYNTSIDSWICHLCPLCANSHKHKYFGCTKYASYEILESALHGNRDSDGFLESITTELTAAMALRHRFYVRAYDEVLKDAPVEQFVSGEGFPELLKFDRELVKKMEIT